MSLDYRATYWLLPILPTILSRTDPIPWRQKVQSRWSLFCFYSGLFVLEKCVLARLLSCLTTFRANNCSALASRSLRNPSGLASESPRSTPCSGVPPESLRSPPGVPPESLRSLFSDSLRGPSGIQSRSPSGVPPDLLILMFCSLPGVSLRSSSGVPPESPYPECLRSPHGVLLERPEFRDSRSKLAATG